MGVGKTKATTSKLLAFLCAMIQQIAQEEAAVSEAQLELIVEATKEYNQSIKEEDK